MKLPSVFSLLCATLSAAALANAQAPERFDPALKEFVERFKGGGALPDGSKPLTPEGTVRNFKVASGLEIEVVAHEPIIRQPLNINFDERGRLWVVQYLQYPYPEGLKVVKYDQYLRAVFDKVPEPPPRGAKGADKITILEDTNGDGHFDSHKDFVTGLNIASSVLTGRGGVWVLNPPYLLFYPDANQDDIPDGDPEVHLSGFGLEDTHSVANSLTWGPDGWLYGVNGSTTTGLIKGIRFLGQCVWRYHPITHEFEIWAEGGGNTFSLEFDSKGRVFSGTNNGRTRGLHYTQGGNYVKNWGKHGPLINPYSFGFFEHMAHQGYEPRFAQTMIIYEGGALLGYEGQIIAGMSLVNRVQASQLLRDTSTYQTVDTEALVLTDDRWFRPVDTKLGPDGAVYFADWYDSRLSHLDPRDTWDREHGRIYRLKRKGATPLKPFDLSKLSGEQLIPILSHANKWFRQQARCIFADRHDSNTVPALKELVENEQGQLALEALWAVNLSGGFDEAFALRHLDHPNPDVRSWIVRLLGDSRNVTPAQQRKLVSMARIETDAQVRSQMAGSAKRLPARDALPIVRELLRRSEDAEDKHIPLLLWWALENKAVPNRKLILEMLQESALWHTPIFNRYITARLGQRYTAERTEANFETAAQLLALAPTPQDLDLVVQGMEEGLQGDVVQSVPDDLTAQIDRIWSTRPHTPALISLALRLGHKAAMPLVLERAADPKEAMAHRQKYLNVLGARRPKGAVEVLVKLLRAEKNETLRLDILNAMQRFTEPDIPQAVLDLYPGFSTRMRRTAQSILASRSSWSRLLLEAVDQGNIRSEQIAVAILAAIQNHHDPALDELIKKHWGRIRLGIGDKERRVDEVRRILGGGKGDLAVGHHLFQTLCATCHTFKGEGAKIGPDLTGYERDNLDFMLPAIIDPSLGIREEYTAFEFTTGDDQTLVGFIVEDTPQAVTLLDMTQNRVTLARQEIESLQASNVSVMPEGLLDALTPQQIRDLFSYLMQKN